MSEVGWESQAMVSKEEVQSMLIRALNPSSGVMVNVAKPVRLGFRVMVRGERVALKVPVLAGLTVRRITPVLTTLAPVA